MSRPTGVTILAILEVIGALLMFLVAVAFGIFANFIPASEISGVPFLGLLLAAGSIIFAILGIIALIVAYGLWTGKSWGWWLAVIFTVINLISSLASILEGGVVGLVISGIILYYLTRPHVREFFGV